MKKNEEFLKFRQLSPNQRFKKSALLCVAGLFVGFINGFFGAGGGMLLVPVLGAILCLNEKQSHATAILLVLPLCVVSAVVYMISEPLDKTFFTPVIIGVVLGGVLGAVMLKGMSNKILTYTFYIVMLVAGIRMML